MKINAQSIGTFFGRVHNRVEYVGTKIKDPAFQESVKKKVSVQAKGFKAMLDEQKAQISRAYNTTRTNNKEDK